MEYYSLNTYKSMDSMKFTSYVSALVYIRISMRILYFKNIDQKRDQTTVFNPLLDIKV